jgi:hypothetical protein
MLLDPDTTPMAEQIYEILESDGPRRPLSAEMRSVVDECGKRWPAYDSAGNEIAAPWASWPLARELERPVIELNIQWEYATAMFEALTEIAGRHGIVLFDPQTGKVHLPPRLA